MSRVMEQANIIGGACIMVLAGVFGQYWLYYLGF